MASTYTAITLEQMETLLRADRGWSKSVVGAEYVFEKFVVEPRGQRVSIRVFSSIHVDNSIAREVGADAIRVCVPMRMKSRRVYRTTGWMENLTSMVLWVYMACKTGNYEKAGGKVNRKEADEFFASQSKKVSTTEPKA